MTPRRERPGSLLALAWGLTLVAAVVGVYVGWRAFWFLTDDAFIAFRYVSNAVLGHGYVWNAPPFRPVEGYTSFLWVVLLQDVWLLTGIEPPEAANWISLGLGYATLALGVAMVLRMALPPAVARHRLLLLALVLAGTIGNRTFLTWLSSGLETSLFNLCLTWWFFLASAAEDRRHRLFVLLLSTSAALTALTRPDGMLVVLGTLLILARHLGGRARQGAGVYPEILGVLPLAAVPAHLLFRYHTYGEWVPNTYVAKHLGAWPESGLRYAASFLVENGFWVWALLLAGWLAVQRRAGAWRPVELLQRHFSLLVGLGVLAGHAGYYTLVIGGDHFEYRVLSHLVLLLFVSTAWLAVQLRPRAAAAILGFAVLTSLPLPWTHWALTRDLDTREQTHVLIVPLAPHLPAVVRPLVSVYDDWQRWLIIRHVGMRHQEHKVFWQLMSQTYPDRSEGEKVSDQGLPVADEVCVGVIGWALPHVAIIDRAGLNDHVVARSPFRNVSLVENTPMADGDYRKMAHDRAPPPGYVGCFRPNVVVQGREVTVLPRDPPLTEADIVACETRDWY